MIIGIDPGSHSLGCCVYDDKNYTVVKAFQKRLEWNSLVDLAVNVKEFITLLLAGMPKKSVVAMERMFITMNKGAKNTLPLILVSGVIEETCGELGVSILQYAPITVKKFMGDCHMDKKEICEKIVDVWGMSGFMEERGVDKFKYFTDASDAAAIALCRAANGNKTQKLEVTFKDYIKPLK